MLLPCVLAWTVRSRGPGDEATCLRHMEARVRSEFMTWHCFFVASSFNRKRKEKYRVCDQSAIAAGAVSVGVSFRGLNVPPNDWRLVRWRHSADAKVFLI